MENFTKLNDLESAALGEIDLNANISFAELGRKLNVSKVTAAKIIERLQQRQIILGFSAVIDVGKIKHTAYGVFIKLKNISQNEYNKLIEKISSSGSVHGIAECAGPYDLMFALNTDHVYSLYEVLASIQQSFAKYFQDCRISTRISVNYYSREYLKTKMQLPRNASFVRTLSKTTEQISLDQLDKNILNILGKNARTPITEIANTLGIARTTVYNRISYLESKKVIIGYLTRIQSPKFGYQVFQLLVSLQNKSPVVVAQILKWASTEPSIIHAVHVLANWDFEITCEVSHQDEVQKIIRRLWSSGPELISNIEIALVFTLFHKYAFAI